MVKLQLTLKSDKPNFVHALNGKSFKLQPGANTLILEYDDYVSLAGALGIKPIENETKSAPAHFNDECSDTLDTTDELASEDVQSIDDESSEQTDTVDDTALEQIEQETIENTDEQSQDAELEDNIESNTAEVETEAKKELIDYSSWPISRLKSKYKSVTGNACKLKKDEIIEFLQNKDKDSDV